MSRREYLDRKLEWIDRGMNLARWGLAILMVTFVICMYEMKVYDPNIFAEGVFFLVLGMVSLLAFLVLCLGFHK